MAGTEFPRLQVAQVLGRGLLRLSERIGGRLGGLPVAGPRLGDDRRETLVLGVGKLARRPFLLDQLGVLLQPVGVARRRP